MKAELEEISKDPFEKKALEYFDFISWLESKITGQPFANIVRAKALRSNSDKPDQGLVNIWANKI